MPEIGAEVPELPLRAFVPEIGAEVPELRAQIPEVNTRVPLLGAEIPQLGSNASIPEISPDAFANAQIPEVSTAAMKPRIRVRSGEGKPRQRVRAASAISTLNEAVNSPRSYSPALVDVDAAEARDAELGPRMNRELDETVADERVSANQQELTDWAERNAIDEDTVTALREEIAEREAVVQAEIDEAEVLADALTAEVECRIG